MRAGAATPRPYVPLWCKSNYSFLEGASHPEELLQTCAALGLPAMALTDRDGVYGVVRALVASRQLPVSLIIGSELTLEDGATMVLLAQDREGYARLCRLISDGRLRSEKGVCRLRWPELCLHAPGLIALWSKGLSQASPDTVASLREAFSDRLYAILPRHREPEDPEREESLREAASRYRLPLVAATEVLYHDRSRRRLQDALACLHHQCTLDQAGRLLRPNDEHELKSPQEFGRLYGDEPELIERTLQIASRCHFHLDEIRYRYPTETVPEGFTAQGWLRKLTYDGALERYGGTARGARGSPRGAGDAPPSGAAIPQAVRKQLEKELALIDELGYCGYFLTMRELVEFCRHQGILCQGRGSAANSAVCYCLGITAVDPVRMELLFERFISRERAEPPDIDLDIEHERREEVIQHMYARYGLSRAAMVANVVRYRGKSAVREMGKVLGVPATTLDRLSRLLSHREGTLEEIIAEAGLQQGSTRVALLVELAQQILDFPRHLSIHPGGFLLGSEPVSRIVPVENATMPGRTVIQWDKTDVEEMGLFKVDLLGLGALTHLHYCFQLLERHLGLELSMATLPSQDEAVFDQIGEGDTVGVFQLESRAQMAMLPRLRPRSYYDLVVEVSLVRPGPITGGMVHPYLRRRNGEEAVLYPHPSLEPVLRKTLGVPLFQEQVMKLAVIAAGYTPGEADQLRRDMAAWRRSGRIEGHRQRLVSGMLRKGISREFAEGVFEQIRGFGEYGFPESHAASFALIAWCTAWMKHHFPVVFTCALLNAWPMGFYAPESIVEDAKRHGVAFLPVNVLQSEWECTLVPRRAEQGGGAGSSDAGLAVRMGLRYVKGLSRAGCDRILAARKTAGTAEDAVGDAAGVTAADPGTLPPAPAAGHALTIEEFVRKARLDEDTLVCLARGGALECFGVERRSSIWEILGARGHQGRGHGRGFAILEREQPQSFALLGHRETIFWDHAALSHSTLAHPLEPYRERLSARGLPDALSVARAETGKPVSYAGLVICRQRPENAGGALFLTLEDETGFVNCVVWDRTFQRYRALILTSSVLGVTGKLEKEGRVVHIIVQRCWDPFSRPERLPARSRDFH